MSEASEPDLATWTPVVTDPVECARILAVVREIAGAVATHPPSDRDLDARVDRAILRRYLAQDGAFPDLDDAAGEDLAAAATRLGAGGYSVALYGGAARVGWGIAHLAAGEEADAACCAIDAALMSRMAGTWQADFDVILGLAGVGVYGLERAERPGGREVIARLLDHLAAIACEVDDGTAWFTPAKLLPPWQRELAPRGCYNLGVAHGTPGVIAWLARCVMRDIHAERARPLLARAVAYVVGAALPAGRSRYPRWRIDGHDAEPASPQLAWCYGDLGVSVALLAAAQALGDAHAHELALALARACATRTLAEGSGTDAGLCHGSAGAAHLLNRIWQATREPVFADAARTWIAHTLAIRTGQPIAGYPADMRLPDDPVGRWRADPTLLTGATGVALALHAAVSNSEPAWDRLMLADLAIA